jgi:alkylhydroperoxidase family enzyme
LTDVTYENAKNFFSEELIAQIIMAVVIINAWNRIAISTKMPVLE